MKPKVSVIGVGRLGLSFALLLDSKGYDVCGCDVNEKYIQSLKDKTFSSKEPLINEMLADCDIDFTTNTVLALNYADIIFVFVPTPSQQSGAYNHEYIEQVVSTIDSHGGAVNKTVAICSTVMPGYCDSIQKRLSLSRVVYSPSFISQGTICNDLKNADIVLVGGRIPASFLEVYTSIMEKAPNFKSMSLIAAEITKISLNCFLTTKISFANRIGEICINSGIENEVENVLNAIGSDRRVGNEFLRYGYGFSGVCLPRDNRALGVHASKVGISPKFQKMIDDVNLEHLYYLHNYFVNANPNKEVPFVFYQLSYKRGVDILTESQPLKLCLRLLEDGYSVNILESESVTEQAKPFLDKYGSKVSYTECKSGFVINLI